MSEFEKTLKLMLLNINGQCLPLQHLNKTYGTDVPLVLMNSFNTDEDTEKILQRYSQVKVKIFTFNQSRSVGHCAINRYTVFYALLNFWLHV